MLRKWISLALVAAFALPMTVKADEGMWLPMFLSRLNHVDMQKEGLNLTAEELYSINNSSLKDAIVNFGGFCTGEMISDQGLVLTNHHCGYGAIQSHSTPENDYLTDGFWAMNKNEELANEDLFVQYLVEMRDVTKRVLSVVNDDMSEDERSMAIATQIKEMKAKMAEKFDYVIEIKDFFEGNEFYAFMYEKYTDVRLVGAPPSSVGKYGGDTDNWMWPRHTGDFSMFRVYSAPDGSPADYAKENVPLKPRHHLPISLKGVKDGDYAMIWGYPGSTDRYLSSYGVEQAIEVSNPSVVDVRDLKLEIMDKHMDADPATRIKYAAKHAQTANYWKYFIGQTKGLKRLNVFGDKQKLENDFQNWADADPARKAKYGNAIQLLKEGYAATDKNVKGNTYLREAGIRGSETLLFAFRMGRMMGALNNPEVPSEKKEAIRAQIQEQVDAHFKDYNMALDQELFAKLMAKYFNDISADQHPAIFAEVTKKYNGDFTKYAEAMYSSSYFVSKDRFEEFLGRKDKSGLLGFLRKSNAKLLENDMANQAAASIFEVYFAQGNANAEAEAKMAKGYRLFVDGLRKMNPTKSYYPNANFTMRCTYGKVGDYYPADAVHYDYYTTMEGLMQKMDNKNPEFVVPQKLVDLYENEDYGQYVDADGKLHVCFISNNDITGGNSGSPVINGDGELIGTAFDGNWEAMSGDIAFEHKLQRTISVDIRYVLFIIDKYAGATNLIDEMTLVK